MPNGAQASTEEGEASGGEASGGESQEEEEWDSDVAEDDDDDDDDDGEEDDVEDEEEEEEEVVPPRSERRSKLVHDPSTERGKGLRPLLSRPSALGPPLRCRLKRRRSSPGRPHRSRPSSCRR